jgi:hypothetical protein
MRRKVIFVGRMQGPKMKVYIQDEMNNKSESTRNKVKRVGTFGQWLPAEHPLQTFTLIQACSQDAVIVQPCLRARSPDCR